MATKRTTSLEKKAQDMRTLDVYSFRISPSYSESSSSLVALTKKWIYLYEAGKITPKNNLAHKFYKKPSGESSSSLFGKIEYAYDEDKDSYYYAWDNGQGKFGYIGADYYWYRHGTKLHAYVPKTKESKELVGAKKQAKRDERQAKVDKVTAKVSASVDKKVTKAKSSAKSGGKFIARGFLKMYGLNVPTALQSTKGGFSNGEIRLTDRQIGQLIGMGYDVESEGLENVPFGVLQKVINGTSAPKSAPKSAGGQPTPKKRAPAPPPEEEEDIELDDDGGSEQTVDVKTRTLTKKQRGNLEKAGFRDVLEQDIIELPLNLLYLLQ